MTIIKNKAEMIGSKHTLTITKQKIRVFEELSKLSKQIKPLRAFG